jgi:DNA polymerase IV
MRTAPTFLHADLDAFYASVEQLLDPSLRGVPIAVGGGVVLAASYEAKAFGVSGGMNATTARHLCPSLRFVDGHFSEYQRLGDEVMTVFSDFTPLVERISIDEAFLDVAGALNLFGSPRSIARKIRERVRQEVGLPISVGAATTKHLAKVASQVAKPDGLVVVEAGTEREFLHPLPVDLVWGVGPVTKARLLRSGITTIGQLAEQSPDYLHHLVGHAAGNSISARANNQDDRTVVTARRARSVGAQSALGRKQPTAEVLRSTLGFLADRIARRLRTSKQCGRTVTVRVRFADLRAVTRSTTLAESTASTLQITDIAVGLVERALAENPEERTVSLLAISVSGLEPGTSIQLGLPFEEQRTEVPVQRHDIDHAMDSIRTRFGSTAVGYLTAWRGGRESVPNAFRELAEHDL